MDATRGSEIVDETSDSLSLLGKTREEEEKEDKEKDRSVREREEEGERRGKVRKRQETDLGDLGLIGRAYLAGFTLIGDSRDLNLYKRE